MAAITFNTAHRPAGPRVDERATAVYQPRTPFQPLDPDVVSASIPAFFIGRNRAGLWVAREAAGRIGGLFLFRSSAVEFARTASAPSRCALVYPAETFELDVKNQGNPLIARLARWMGQARRRLGQIAAE